MTTHTFNRELCNTHPGGPDRLGGTVTGQSCGGVRGPGARIMPLGGAALSDVDFEVVRSWIETGANDD